MSELTNTLSSMKDRLAETVSPGSPDGSNSRPADASGTADSGGSSAADSGSGSTSGSGSNWTAVDSPTGKSLFGVVTTENGPYAVGTGGKVLHRSSDGWSVVIDEGPATKRNKLTCVAASDDGKRIWFAGSSGALGMYDTVSGRKYDYTAPGGKTSTWEGIAIGGEAGDEHLRIANGSGEVLSASIGERGCPTFGDVVKPGSGSTVPALDFGGDAFYAIDTSGNVFEESLSGDGNDGTDGSGSGAGDWTDLGIENAQVNFFDVNATENSLLVAGGGGRVYRYDRACTNWTPVDAGTGALHALGREDNRVVAVGANGHVFERQPNAGWVPLKSPVEVTLQSVALGDVDVAVGAGGAIIERR